MSKTVSTTVGYSDSWSKTHSETKSQSESKSQSTTQKVMDEALRDQILAGLMGYMSDEEIDAYAKNLLSPQLEAQMEAAEQNYETTQLTRQQEIDSLSEMLAKSIGEQEKAYKKSMAQVQNAALARGMGRSSYTLESLAGQGDALARAVADLTQDTQRQQSRIQEQISLAAKQKAQTQGRLQADYAQNLAAKKQELKAQQAKDYNQNYLAAVSGSMGSQTTGQQNTTGFSTTDSEKTSHTDSYKQTVTKRS